MVISCSIYFGEGRCMYLYVCIVHTYLYDMITSLHEFSSTYCDTVHTCMPMALHSRLETTPRSALSLTNDMYTVIIVNYSVSVHTLNCVSLSLK